MNPFGMNPHVNAIGNRLSLRTPQRDALEILARICEIVPLDKEADPVQAQAVIQSEFATVTDFERDFQARGIPPRGLSER